MDDHHTIDPTKFHKHRKAKNTLRDSKPVSQEDTSAPVSQPLVTAAITTYNRSQEVKRAVKSVLHQTYEPIDLVVVEDGSDNGISTWLDSEGIDAQYVRHETNRGLAAARNTATKVSRADYIAFLDDDDEWKPRRIERTVDRLRSLAEPQLETFGVVYCGTERRSNGQVLSIGHPKNEGKLKEAIMSVGVSTLPSSCLFSRAALVDVGGYDESLTSSVDHDIWMALAVGGYEAYTVDEPLVVTHNPFEASMVTDTDTRIRGVRRFVEKWTPTFEEWWGGREGRAFARKYFIRVISRLAAVKLVTGQFDEAKSSINAMLEESDGLAYPAWSLMVHVAETAIKRFLPPVAVRHVSRMANQLGY